MAHHFTQVYDDDVDYLALAEALIAMPRAKRKLILWGIEIMADGHKRNTAGVTLLLLAATFLVGAAYVFRVSPGAFGAIVLGSILLVLVAFLLWKRIL